MKKIKLLLLLVVVVLVIVIGLTRIRKPLNTIETPVPALVQNQVNEDVKTTNDKCQPYKFTDLNDSYSLNIGEVTKYTNRGYGFSIIYPSNFQATSTFDTGYLRSNNWKQWGESCFNYDAYLRNLSGKNILQLQLRNDNYTDSAGDQLNYLSQLRIGASDEAGELSKCLIASYNEKVGETVLLNGIKFNIFEGSDSGLTHRLHTLSYRTIHDNKCYAVELVRSYNIQDRDDWMVADIKEFEKIVSTFTFI